jgi:hypothetical protein
MASPGRGAGSATGAMIHGSWAGDPGRRGIQFESLRFGERGALEARIVTLCTRGFCPSIVASGTYSLIDGTTIELMLDGITQRFTLLVSGDCLRLRDQTNGHEKSYVRAERRPS